MQILKHPIISSVIAGLILWLLAWINGYISSIWTLAKTIILFIWSVINYDVAIPIWLLIVLSIPIIAMIINYVKNKQQIKVINSDEEKDTNIVKGKRINLSDEEYNVMKLFVEADGKPIKIITIKYRYNYPNLKAEQIMEALEKKLLIETYSDFIEGTSTYLTKLGRDFMMGNKYENT